MRVIDYEVAGCRGTDPAIAGAARVSEDVSVSQDRDKGVVKLSGHVPGESDRQQAGSIATTLAAGQVVANEIAVVAPGVESASPCDFNLGCRRRDREESACCADFPTLLDKQVKYSVKNGVITLTGTVQFRRLLRTQAAQQAAWRCSISARW